MNHIEVIERKFEPSGAIYKTFYDVIPGVEL